MKSKKSSAGGILFRATGFLVAGVMTSMVLLGTLRLDTNSWFTSQMTANMEVSAASTEDILRAFELDGERLNDGSFLNPTAIKLEKSDNIEYDPTIYFEVEGNVAEYILQINSVKLEDNGVHSRSIDVNVNSVQNDELSDNETVTGKIRIKYLNGFIDEKFEVTFTGEYLKNKHNETIITGVSSGQDMANLITNIASLIDWPEPTSDQNYLMESPSKMIQKFETQNVLSKDSEQESYTEKLLEVPMDKLVLSSEQSKIINVIAPTLQKYLDNLYDLVVNLVTKINEQIRMIAGLEQKIEILDEEAIVLNQQLEEISIEKDNLSNENESLKNENQDLKNQNQDSMKEIQDLKDQIEDLKSSLRSELSTNDTNTQSLREEVARLEEELKNEKSPNVEPPKEVDQEEEVEEPLEEETEDPVEEVEEEPLEEETEDLVEEIEEELTEEETEDPVEEVEEELIEEETEDPVEEIEEELTEEETEDPVEEIEEEATEEETEDPVEEIEEAILDEVTV